MKLYKEMYLHLFNAVTDALRFLSVRDIENAVRILRQGQITVSYTHLTLPTMIIRCRSRWSPYH